MRYALRNGKPKSFLTLAGLGSGASSQFQQNPSWRLDEVHKNSELLFPKSNSNEVLISQISLWVNFILQIEYLSKNIADATWR